MHGHLKVKKKTKTKTKFTLEHTLKAHSGVRDITVFLV